MDTSEKDVKLLSGFVFDVLSEYDDLRGGVCEPLFKMVEGLDETRADEWVPISLYNEVCPWVEETIGGESIEAAGRAIGARAFSRMVDDGVVRLNPSPRDIWRD